MPITPDNLPDDPAALKRIIAAMSQDALTAQAEIARLKFQLARYRRAEFGRSSEKLGRESEQLELALEALETDQAERRQHRRLWPRLLRALLKRRSRRAARCRNTCRERICAIPRHAPVPVVVAHCARSPTR